MPPLIRAFVAAELSAAVRAELAAALAELRRAEPGVKWTAPENLHLTLKFLGELPAEILERAHAAVALAAASCPPLELTVRGVGAFPPRGAPRVLWVGCADRPPALGAAVLDLETRLDLVGIPREARDFAAHVTLGRVKTVRRPDRLRAALAPFAGALFGVSPVADWTLFSSRLLPTGPVYTALARFPLGATGAGSPSPATAPATATAITTSRPDDIGV
ncbi:MAG: RNA 2',3'-cyclic phosphodiesterase [Planctomycetes bacterium]|nr:RNA 2',3'-cyclic phosphodiesterase [Planctomycetota bacterium]